MKTRTLLVDASYLFKQSFHGNKDTFNSKGQHIGGLYTFYIKLRKLIKDYHINKTILVWDGENGGILRHNIDSNYKSNRDKSWNEKLILSEYQIKKEEEKKQSTLWQRERIKAYAEELFLRQIEENDVEGDDLIAAYCQQYNNKEEIFLYTNDRDFLQMLYLNITIIFANIDMPITRGNFYFKFDYHYGNAILMKTICGDDVDCIKGIKGMGEDTLLKYFPELKERKVMVREICQRAVEINKERIANKKKPIQALKHLTESVEQLKLNFSLVNLEKPLLNDNAIDLLEQLEYPLAPEGRGSKNLLAMMQEDDILKTYRSNFVSYVEPFYTVIQYEKDLYQEYERNLRINQKSL